MAGTIRTVVKTTADNAGFTSAEAAAEKFGGKVTAASALATAGIAGIGIAAISMAAGFEQSMDQVGAVSGATAAEMGKLSVVAKQIGADTAFSARDAAGAMEELAQGGRSVAQIMGGEARAAVDLAAAGNYGLAESGKAIATVMDVWKGTQLETNTVVNRLAGAANASRFGVDDMAQAVAQAGGVAAQMGVSFEDLTSVVATTASSFASGSDAGTSFKTFLLGLDGSTDKAKKLIGELGLEFRDGAGHIKSMAEIADELATKVGVLGEAEQVAALKTIFGNDAYRTAAGLMDATATGVQKVNDVLANTSAADIAATRMGNLKGDVEALKGSMETLGIAVGEKALPPLASMAGVATTAVNGFAGLPESTQGIALGFTAISVAAPATISAIGKIAEGAKAMRAAMAAGSAGPWAAATAVGIGAIALGLDAVLQKTAGKGLGEVIFGANGPQTATAFNDQLERTKNLLAGTGVVFDPIVEATKQWAEANDRLNNSSKQQVDWDRYAGSVHGYAQSLVAAGASIGQLKDAYDSISTEGGQAIFEKETQVLEKWRIVMQAASADELDQINNAKALRGAHEEVAAVIPKAMTALDAFNASLEEGDDRGKAFDETLSALSGRFSSMDPVYQANAVQLSILKEELGDLTASGDTYSMSLGLTRGEIEAAIATIEKQNGAMAANSQGYRDIAAGMETMSANAGMLFGTVLNVDKAIRDANLSAEAQVTAIGNAATAVGAFATNDIPAAVQALGKLGEASPAAMKALVDGITDPAIRSAVVEGMIALGGAAAAGLVQGLDSPANRIAVYGAAKRLAAEAVSGGAAGIDSQSPSKEFAKLGKYSAEGYIEGIKEGTAGVKKAVAEMMMEGIVEGNATIGVALGPAGGAALGRGNPGTLPIPVGNSTASRTSSMQPFVQVAPNVWWDPNPGGTFSNGDLGGGAVWDPNSGTLGTQYGANEVYRDAQGVWRSMVDDRIVTNADGSFMNDDMRKSAQIYDRSTRGAGWGGQGEYSANTPPPPPADPRAGFKGFDPARDMPGADAHASGPKGNSIWDLQEMYLAQAATVNGERPDADGWYHGWMNESADGTPYEVWINGPDAWGGAHLAIGSKTAQAQYRAWSSVVGYIGQTREQAKAKPMRRTTSNGTSGAPRGIIGGTGERNPERPWGRGAGGGSFGGGGSGRSEQWPGGSAGQYAGATYNITVQAMDQSGVRNVIPQIIAEIQRSSSGSLSGSRISFNS